MPHDPARPCRPEGGFGLVMIDAEEDDDGDNEADVPILTWICENQHKSKEVYYTHRCQTRKPSSRNDIYVFLKCKLF